jgi:cell division septum initiation protein DivIVA
LIVVLSACITEKGVVEGTADIVGADIAAVQSEQTAQEARIAVLEAELQVLQETVASLGGGGGDVAALTTRVTALESSVDTVEATVAPMQGDIATLQSRVDTVEATVAPMQGDIATLQSTVNATDDTLAGLSGDVEALQADLAALIDSVDAVSVQSNGLVADLASLEEEFASLAGSLETVLHAQGTIVRSTAEQTIPNMRETRITILDTVVYDPEGNWNPDTDTYTAPVDGWYFVSATAPFNTLSAAQPILNAIWIRTSSTENAAIFSQQSAYYDAAAPTVSGLFHLRAGDTVTVSTYSRTSDAASMKITAPQFWAIPLK